MIKLDKTLYDAAFTLYQATDFFFPLIGAVLLREQDGVVYADNPVAPQQVYVEHAFGFAQIFGSTITVFESDLKRYLLTERLFACAKVRLYTPYLPDFLRDSTYDRLRSFRQRFLIDSEGLSKNSLPEDERNGDMALCAVDERNIHVIEHAFGVVDRFWRGAEDFIRKASAVMVLYQGQPASICYAAAQADRRVEIDVLTLSEYRMLGTGKFAVAHFVRQCFEQSLQPLWDCFTNNAGSMSLCRSLGFIAPNAPYPFFTIPKQGNVAS